MAERRKAKRKAKPRARRSSPFRIWRRRLGALAIVVLALAAGYVFWFRNSSLVDVRKVEVSGLTSNSAEISAALQSAAADMTTLHVRNDKLRRAVGRFPTVGSIKIDASPPHELKIVVTERKPAALLEVSGATIPVSADGWLLRGLHADPGLPTLNPSQHVGEVRLAGVDLEQAALLGAVPEKLRKQVDGSRYASDQGGVTVDLANGIELRMGDGSAAAAKWAAAASVLADPNLGSPAYIDVSVPDRPVAGGYSG